MDEFGMYTW
jgi:MORN repeat